MTIPINRTKSHTKSKSVQFQDNIVEISAGNSSDIKKSFTPNSTHLTIDEVRRLSYAGRTPFSCTTSRSGSTPGRKDFPSKILPDIEDLPPEKPNFEEISQSTINDTKNSKSTPKRRKSKSFSKLFPLRWSVRKDSIIERDPYPLRSQTPNKSRLTENESRQNDVNIFWTSLLNSQI